MSEAMDDSSEVVTKGFLRDTLRTEIREALRPVVGRIVTMQDDVADIRRYMKTELVTRNEFHARMDAFAGRVDDADVADVRQRARLDDHERRISALEKKPS